MRSPPFCSLPEPVGVALGVYNWVAFGSPFHFSYGYVDIPSQKEGFFGISAPTWAGLDAVLFGLHGIFREQPILVVAAVGLVFLWRRGFRAEAAACGATALAFVLMRSGYFDPYGGVRPVLGSSFRHCLSSPLAWPKHSRVGRK